MGKRSQQESIVSQKTPNIQQNFCNFIPNDHDPPSSTESRHFRTN